ncbi:VRR-NUC domain-containing protein [candidate division KSB1 bacterium]|nr:VRR-NUC domain-containing protein [candidate division KSB1 bacterium]
MNKDRIEMLQKLVTWREITNTDIENCGIDFPIGLNDHKIFPRNALLNLFNYYHKQKKDNEIIQFSRLILKYMSKDNYYCLFYGKEFKKILTYLQKANKVFKAKNLCEYYLLSLGVLKKENNSLSISDFSAGNYSYSFPVIFLNSYMSILLKLDETKLAKKLLKECLYHDDLKDDSKIMFKRILDKLDKKKIKYNFPTIEIKKNDLDSKYLNEPKIELTALNYLRDALNYEGIFADVDIWRLIFNILTKEISEEDFNNFYKEIAGISSPPDFYEFVLYNESMFKIACESRNVTFGFVGYPDLILYSKKHFADYIFFEVKDINDRLQPHQEALLNYYIENNINCRLLKFLK